MDCRVKPGNDTLEEFGVGTGRNGAVGTESSGDCDVSRFEEALEALQRLRLPCDLSFRRDGGALAVAVQPAVEDAERGLAGRLWLLSTAGEQTQLTHGPGSDALPRFSPVDDHLAFASDRTTRGGCRRSSSPPARSRSPSARSPVRSKR